MGRLNKSTQFESRKEEYKAVLGAGMLVTLRAGRDAASKAPFKGGALRGSGWVGPAPPPPPSSAEVFGGAAEKFFVSALGVLTARCSTQCDVSPARTLKVAETWPVCTVCNGWVMLWMCLGKTRFGGIVLGGSGDDAPTKVSHFNVFSLRPCVPSERVYIALKRCIL